MWKNANSFFTGVFTAVIIDSRLLKNSGGNRDCEWIFCRRREADVALFLQVTRMRKIVKICGTKQTKRIEIHQSRITTASHPSQFALSEVTRGGLEPSATSEIAVDDWERGWNHKSWLSELAQVNTCFLRGMLRWLTEEENPKYAKRTARYNEFRYKYLDKLSIHLVRESVHLTVSLGISKTIPCLNKLMQIENWETDHVQYSLYVDISYKFTLACVFVSHACRQITVNTFINDLYSLQG